jgi:hypothetical protein
MRNKSQNASGIPISCTILLAVITRQSGFPSLCQAKPQRRPCLFLFEEISPLTTCMSKVLGSSPKSLRALAFLGWFTYRTSTLRQPRRPSYIVLRPLVRPQSARHTLVPRFFDLAQCSDTRISSSTIYQVSRPFRPVLCDLKLYDQRGQSGGS